MKLYVAGPMRGYERFNFPAFDEAAAHLRSQGHDVISPAEMDRALGLDEYGPLPDWWNLNDAMRADLRAITECEAIVLLRGWEKSEGVRHELAAARACGLVPWVFDPDVDPVLRVLAEDTEHMVVDPVTGGQKGQKPQRFDLIPWDVLWELAEHYGRGGEKHGDRNWERGYAWSLNFAALCRHLTAWWTGENIDAETGSSHLLAVIWHALTLRFFQLHGRGTDDRPAPS